MDLRMCCYHMNVSEAIYKSTMEEDIGCGLQMKSQQELFWNKEKYILKQPKEKKKFISSQQISLPSQKSNDVSDRS